MWSHKVYLLYAVSLGVNLDCMFLNMFLRKSHYAHTHTHIGKDILKIDLSVYHI